MTLTKSDLSKIGEIIDRKLDGQEERFIRKLTGFKNELFEKIDQILTSSHFPTPV